MARAVKTSKNGRPYIINSEGRSEFISLAAAKKAGWEKPAKKKAAAKKAPASKKATAKKTKRGKAKR